jgi:hypothetical protein
MNEIGAARNKTIMTLLKLQAYGVTDDEILHVYDRFNGARLESASTIRR